MNGQNKLYHVLQIAVLVAIMVVLSYVKIPIGPVPIVLENLGVMLAALLLGSKRGTLSVIAFVVIRMLGLGGPGGLSLLISPVSGYMYGWILMPVFISLLVKVFHARRWVGVFISTALAGVILDDFVCGSLGLMTFSHLSLTAALGFNLVFLIGDILKSVVATILDIRIKASTHFQELLK